MREALQRAIDHIEAHLTEEIDVHGVAAQAYVSAFHFQRIFSALCGMPLGEYVRGRRMTLAAQELRRGMKVIDAAMKYGYDSPDSFARAFRRFHGVLPSQAGLPGVTLNALAPMKISLIQEGTSMMTYRIERKEAFTVVGYKRAFSSDTSYQEIPAWWTALMAQQPAVMGQFGVCIDSDGKDFDYMIADLYQPWRDVPADCETYAIPGGLWAEFPCRGPLPESLQKVNTQIWSEWLPAMSGYELAGNYSLEVYAPPTENPKDDVSWIWIPLKKAE